MKWDGDGIGTVEFIVDRNGGGNWINAKFVLKWDWNWFSAVNL